ncbi:MAG: protein-disulfide reductase DsbD domain-containing protein [Bacteroidota bacterium]
MKLLVSVIALLFQCQVMAQPNPVSWAFTAKKSGDKTFEVEMKATIIPGWHLYSQQQPADAIAIPTEFVWNQNPLVQLKGKIREVGKMERYKDATLGVTAHQYSGQVTFVQTVELKAKVKTALSGTVEYQTCDDEKCLPPKKVPFTISLK